MKRLYFIASTCLVMACATPQKVTAPVAPSSLVPNGKLWSSLFQQKAAEYKALCIQAYNIAQFRLDEAIQQPSPRPKAIISDIDETILDNSPYAVHQALGGKDYDFNTWLEWTGKSNADTLAGALTFFKYAASKNIAIFYISNRDEKERAGTLQNLRRFNFPFADDNHLLLRENTSGKEVRRQRVAANYDIVLLIGDNLSDFSDLFDKKTTAERAGNVQRLFAEFGNRFIVLPNANYGGWEDAIYGNRYDLDFLQKDSAIKANLKSF